MNFDGLADLLILEIFKHLTVKELCRISRVCRRWNNIVKDKSLWRNIDMSDTRLDLRKAWKFFRARLSDCLLSFRMRGYYSVKASIQQKKPAISNALLEDLRSNCPNLRELILEDINLADISASKLPRSLTSLSLEHCGWSLGWLSNADLPSVQCIALLNCARIDDSEIKPLARFPTLETVILKDLYRMKDEGIRYLVENLPQLIKLEIQSLDIITDLAIHYICRNLTNIEILKLLACPLLTNSSVQTIADSLNKLTHLDLSGNISMDQQCLRSLKKLKHLEVIKCSFDDKEIDMEVMDELRSGFCGKLVHNSEEVAN